MDFVVIPWSFIGNTFSGVLAAQERRNVAHLHVLLQFGQVVGANDFDFASSLFVEEAFYDGPDAAEEHGRVHHE